MKSHNKALLFGFSFFLFSIYLIGHAGYLISFFAVPFIIIYLVVALFFAGTVFLSLRFNRNKSIFLKRKYGLYIYGTLIILSVLLALIDLRNFRELIPFTTQFHYLSGIVFIYSTTLYIEHPDNILTKIPHGLMYGILLPFASALYAVYIVFYGS